MWIPLPSTARRSLGTTPQVRKVELLRVRPRSVFSFPFQVTMMSGPPNLHTIFIRRYRTHALRIAAGSWRQIFSSQRERAFRALFDLQGSSCELISQKRGLAASTSPCGSQYAPIGLEKKSAASGQRECARGQGRGAWGNALKLSARAPKI